MDLLIINFVLALVWSALTGRFTLENLTVGFVLGYIVLYLLREVLGSTGYFSKAAQVLRFTAYFLWELLVANLRVARDVLRPGPLRMVPRVISIPLDLRGDVPVTVLANVLSLTPGTLTLDVADDCECLFIHAINAPDAEQVRDEIKNGFERLVIDLFSDQNTGERPVREQES